ncbi:MAG: hypothetical protein IKP45_03995 [Bacteroidales bacterium]|nr:hypothetical protein [Bacteroidales bacterium]
MRKELSIFLVLLALSLSAFAQQLKTYSGNRDFFYGGCSGNSMDLRETYTYYIDKDGNYVKSGNYSAKGTKSKMGGDVTVTYNLTATFKDGKLNGPLSLKYSALGYCMYSYGYGERLYCNEEYILSANFKDGEIDGKWSFSERDGNTSYASYSSPKIYKTTFTCKNGFFVGDFDFNYDPMNNRPQAKGKFDNNGNLISLKIMNCEYVLDTTGLVLSRICRDERNNTISSHKSNDTLLAEYNEQKQSSLLNFIKKKGYYLEEEWVDNKSITKTEFSAAHLLNYIWENCRLFDFVGNYSCHEGTNLYLDGPYATHYVKYKKQEVAPLTDSLWSIIESNLKYKMATNYDVNRNEDSYDNYVIKDIVSYYFLEKQGVKFFNGTILRYMDDSIFEQCKNKLIEDWKYVKDSIQNEKRKVIFDCVETEVKKCLDEIKSWPRDGFEQEYEKYEMSGSGYSQSYNRPIGLKLEVYYKKIWHKGKTIWEQIVTNPVSGIGSKKISIDDVLGKFKKFHKIDGYKIDSMYLSDDGRTCFCDIIVCKYGYGSYDAYKTQAQYARNGSDCNLCWGESFEKNEKIETISDTSYNLDRKISSLCIKRSKNLKSDLTYKTYKSEKNPPSSNEDINVWNNYFKMLISIQKDYITFIELGTEINSQSEKVVSLCGKDVADVAKAYQGASKTWSFDVTEKGKIKEEVKRMEGYLATQDSCISFIELRKNIISNNQKLATFSKTAKNIYGAYTSYFKGADLAWTADNTCTAKLRNVIEVQNQFLKVMSSSKVSELDEQVKKMKDKSFENIKKQIFD